MIAPQGRGRSWQFWGGPSDDSDFALAALADAATRWPIDRARVAVSGFSYGGAMVWRMACDKGDVVKAYLPIADRSGTPINAARGLFTLPMFMD